MPTQPTARPARRTAADKYYRNALKVLGAAEIPFMLGGAFALRIYTGIQRDTKDLDIFLCKRDLNAARVAFKDAGYRTELTYPHWLAKAFSGKNFVDLIFNMANGFAPIDDTWLAHATQAEMLGLPILALAPEEIICSKIMVLDRGRYDGADVAHLIRATAERLDWQRILERSDRHWQVLLSHLVMFGYIYPDEQNRIPQWVLQTLTSRLQQNVQPTMPGERVCRGTMLSPTQYLIDVEQWGYQDARLPPWGTMTAEEVRLWTEGVVAGK